MDQIETLKWIAENGNPIGTPVESEYLKHKTDPTFRNLAMSLASSETGYAGLNDSIKNAYQEYKNTINTPITQVQPQTPESEQGYLSKAFDYASGETQEDPNMLGKVWRGATNSPLYTKPLETLGSIGSAFVPGAGPVSQFVVAPVAGAVGSAVGNVADQLIQTGDVDAKEAGKAGLWGGITNGIGAGIGWGIGKVGAPIAKKLGEYASAVKANTEFLNMLKSEAGSQVGAEYRLAKALAKGGSDQDAMVKDIAEDRMQEVAEAIASGRDITEIIQSDPEIAQAVANRVSRHMQETVPSLKVFGPRAISPTNSEVGAYIAERAATPTVPDFTKTLGDFMPQSKILGYENLPIIPSALVKGIGQSATKLAPKALPATAIGRALLPISETHKDRVKNEQALQSLRSRRDLTETEYFNLQSILGTPKRNRTDAQTKYLQKYGF